MSYLAFILLTHKGGDRLDIPTHKGGDRLDISIRNKPQPYWHL
jgi:hypothetical protein